MNAKIGYFMVIAIAERAVHWITIGIEKVKVKARKAREKEKVKQKEKERAKNPKAREKAKNPKVELIKGLGLQPGGRLPQAQRQMALPTSHLANFI